MPDCLEDKAIKPLFTHTSLKTNTLILLLFALLSMGFDHFSAYCHHLRNQLNFLVFPIQELVNVPIHLICQIRFSLANHHDLLIDNARLRAHEFLLEAKLQKLLALERKNAQLEALLKSTKHRASKVSVAQLLAVSLNPIWQQVVLNKGKKDGLYSGQPVLDAYGVMGQVINLGDWVSQVLLITDKRSAIPVQDYRSGVRAIAVGDGLSGTLSLMYVPDTSDIKTSDLFVTSGLGMRFLVGYPVGRVTWVKKSAAKNFALVHLKPCAHINSTQQVLLVWPERALLSKKVHQILLNISGDK